MNDVLKTKGFQHSKILAGINGLSRVVNTITVAEVPDSANWLRGGELVCTTAFFISKGIKYQTEWVESLILNGATALGIKTTRFLGSIHPSIIELAERYNFPLIELPSDITWPVAIESVTNLLMDQQTKIIQKAEEIHRKLTSLVLDDESVKVIANTISNLVDNPIIVEDVRLNLLVIGQVNSDDTFTDGEQVFNTRLAESFRGKILQSEYYKRVLHGKSKEKYHISPISIQKQKFTHIMMPIFSNKVLYGFISLIDVNRPHTSIDLIALEHGTTALALQFMKDVLHQKAFSTKTLALIEDLIQGIHNTENIKVQNLYNIDWSKPMIAIIVETLGEQITEKDFLSHSEDLFISIFKKHIEKHFENVIIGCDTSQVKILIPFSPRLLNKVTSLLKNTLEVAVEELEQHFGTDNIRVGIGSAYKKLSLLGKSYKEATTALSVSKSFPKVQSIILFENLKIHRIIKMIPNTEELQLFCNDFLAELKEFDQMNGNVMLETLHTYLNCNCNFKQTANILFVHPNTVLYRIKKIQNKLNIDLDNAEDRLTYLFALEADSML
ncbi:PucR family transcriptional regulator ligand-binding domain-containing protein [Bacillus sp. JJ1566]|uniref:PucR family transcriptional regulator n=1 Tax=Bacillus sp. JJ1566 TaxID=3122961 RepID=UPI002FFE5FB2